MTYLLITTLIWSLSFTLIGSILADLDPFLLASLRLGLAALCFAPFFRVGKCPPRSFLPLAGIGCLQFGVMYAAYLTAFQFAPVYVVALFSSFTPLWIAGISALIRRQASWHLFLASGLATTGALVIRWGDPIQGEGIFTAFILMQIANVAFGGGQLAFRYWRKGHSEIRNLEVFLVPYLAAFFFSLTFALGRHFFFAGEITPPSPLQWLVIAYLGVIATGLGFFLWNKGASLVPTSVLAAANNLVVPLGIFFAIIFLDRPPSWIPFIIGSLCIFIAVIPFRKSKAIQ